MNTPSPELQRLVAAYLAGHASAEEVTTLSELLRRDAAARDYYVETADVHATLAVDESLWSRPVAENIVPLPQPDTASHSQSWKLAGIAAAFVICATLAVLWGISRFHRGTKSGPQVTVEQTPALAVLSHALDVQWSGASSNLIEGAELGAGPLTLRRGTVQVDFYSGARVIVVGPAELEIRSAREAHLARGIATCEVDERGRGFQFSAPEMQVVDLGTVFGLKMPDNGGPEVHVLEGRVAVAPAGGARFTELNKAQAVQLANGAFTPTPFAPESFPRSADLGRSEVAESARRFAAWREFSASLDRDPALLAHFTFDGSETAAGGSARNLAQSPGRGSDGMVIGAHQVEGRWPGKRALEFRGRGDRVLLRVPGTHTSLTFAAWVRVDAYQEKVNALLVTEESRRWKGLETGQPPVAVPEMPYTPLRWELRNDGQLALNWERARPADGKHWHIHWAMTDLTPDRLGAWTLLASVVDGARNEVVHYVNGHEVARHPAKIESPFALTRLCLGNMSSTDSEARAGIRYGFFGLMDEVLVANRAFSAQEITRLHESGRP